MAVPESLESRNSFKKRCTETPKGQSAKYRTYSAKVKNANATEKDRWVKAGCRGQLILNDDRRVRLTSKAIPGMNIMTAKAWKNLRRPLTLNTGMR